MCSYFQRYAIPIHAFTESVTQLVTMDLTASTNFFKNRDSKRNINMLFIVIVLPLKNVCNCKNNTFDKLINVYFIK